MDDIFSALIPQATNAHCDEIAKVLRELPTGILTLLVEQRCTIRPLQRGERYDGVSPALARLGIDVDAWPCPPAGLFVVDERTVYLRSRSRMTLIHELSHACDCALGGGVYLSGIDPEIRRAFTSATSFITPYAATGIDEYFAESMRAYLSTFTNVNDATSHWPRATQARLRKCDPTMYAILDGIVSGLVASSVGEQLEMVLR